MVSVLCCKVRFRNATTSALSSLSWMYWVSRSVFRSSNLLPCQSSLILSSLTCHVTSQCYSPEFVISPVQLLLQTLYLNAKPFLVHLRDLLSLLGLLALSRSSSCSSLLPFLGSHLLLAEAPEPTPQDGSVIREFDQLLFCLGCLLIQYPKCILSPGYWSSNWEMFTKIFTITFINSRSSDNS